MGTTRWRMLSSVLWGRGGVSEMEALVKAAKAQSWHRAGNKLLFGGGGIRCLRVWGHSSMTL